MGLKRKSLGQAAPPKKARKASPSVDSAEEVESYAANSTLVDPMIDVQPDSDEDDYDEDEEMGNGDEDDGVEEFDGEDVEEERAAPVAGPSKSRNLYKDPTLAELDQLRTAESSGGNTFSLQLESLVSSTLLSSAPASSLKTLLGAIHDLIHALPELPQLAPKKADKRLGSGKIPFPGPASLSPLNGEPQWKLGFTAPSEVVVGGSWPVCGGYKRAKGEAGNIDIVVVMPSDMFSAKDRTAYRYFHKRAHYLAVISEAVKKEAKKDGSPLHGVKVEWEYADARRPIVAISAGKAQGVKHAVDIRIHASVSPDVFPRATLFPTKSLIRVEGEDEPEATPLISTSILHDTLQKSNLLHLHRLAQTLSGERTVDKFLALWRIWATRRGVPRPRGASGWFATQLLGWVVNGGDVGGRGSQPKRVRGLGKSLGAWAALRAAWEMLAHTDFEETPVFMACDDPSVPKSEFVKAYKDVFVDSTGGVNLFAEWERGDVELLRYYARETLAMLEDSSVDRFAEVFLHDQTLGPATFDDFMIVEVPDADIEQSSVEAAEYPNRIERLSQRAAEVVRRGLTDRVRLVYTRVLDDKRFVLGLLLNGAQATRVLDMGPASDKEDECVTFRELWGERAELRRFKDGSIAESVVWSVARPEEAILIPSRAATWLVNRHIGKKAVVIPVSASEDWLSILQVSASVRNAVNTEGSEKLGFRPMMDGYDALYKLLKRIDSEMPLAILHVAPSSELLRYSATFVPHPIDVGRAASAPECIGYVPVAEVVMQFESSPRWPDDLAAIQKLKLALLEKLAQIIETNMRGVKLNIALDAGASDIEDAASLEILLPEGTAYRVRVHHDRERTLLERALQPPPPGLPSQLPQPPRRLVLPALEKHKRRFNYKPSHHAQLAPMHHRFPSFSTAVRLLKRWAAAHMLSPHLVPEALELLVAHAYLESGTLAAPSSATAGFLRTLTFLASWDWRAAPAFIPLQAVTRDAANASGRPRFPTEAREAATAAFEKRAEHAAWALITEDDPSGARWTGALTPVIAGRVGALARASLTLVREGAEGGLAVEGLFKTPLEHYDAVFYLSPGVRAAEALSPEEKLWKSSTFRNLAGGREVRVDFDPAHRLVEDIQRLYGDALAVFYDVHGGRAIGLLWNPSKDARSFKPFLGYSTMPSEGEAALVRPNRDAVLGEIARLGQGIIERVERRQ